MVREPLVVGKPAKCVLADADGYFKQGDITYVNALVRVPEKPKGPPKPYVMVMHHEGFIYLPSKHFVGLTEEEEKAFEDKVEEITAKYEAPN